MSHQIVLPEWQPKDNENIINNNELRKNAMFTIEQVRRDLRLYLQKTVLIPTVLKKK